ncbi:quinolinate synthase NadA [Bacillus carboniphilus]|uniref:Quinolinate synthase n=1 Tax=Bacillus carboniphilus TaxID=86663 RepID=A0ABP3G307_9BACI
MTILDMMSISTQIPEFYRQATEEELISRIKEAKLKLGMKVMIPGHHYQREEVIQFADVTGDSLQLAQVAAANKEAEYIVFCGVHFMAETADILTTSEQKVILPDMRAGCSMADMADDKQTKIAWEVLTTLLGEDILPLTYVNSTAAIKSFVGYHGGATVTSSNAKKMVSWALQERKRILFLPDQHLGRNTAYDLGVPLEKMAVWDPIKEELQYEGDLEEVVVILWKGHCSVHENFTVQNIQSVRENHPKMKIIVHPECRWEVVNQSDVSGSTKKIIETIEAAEDGSEWAIGTEMNLVKRLIKNHPTKHIISLNPNMCPCLTMNRIDLPHLAWAMDSILNKEPIHLIEVNEKDKYYARLALERMLARA